MNRSLTLTNHLGIASSVLQQLHQEILRRSAHFSPHSIQLSPQSLGSARSLVSGWHTDGCTQPATASFVCCHQNLRRWSIASKIAAQQAGTLDNMHSAPPTRLKACHMLFHSLSQHNAYCSIISSYSPINLCSSSCKVLLPLYCDISIGAVKPLFEITDVVKQCLGIMLQRVVPWLLHAPVNRQ